MVRPAMRASSCAGRCGPKRIYLFAISAAGLLLVIYSARSTEDHVSRHAGRSPQQVAEVGLHAEELDFAEVKADFVDLRGPMSAIVEPAKRSGVVGSLRSLIGLGNNVDNILSRQTEIKLDAHAERALEVLEFNIARNHSNASSVELIGSKTTRNRVRLMPPDEDDVTRDELPRCLPDKSRDRMINLFGDGFNAELETFVSGGFDAIPSMLSLPLPFGLQKSEMALQQALTVADRVDFNVTNGSPCLRCVVVGNGGIISKTSLGKIIDDFDVVIRLNDAPTSGYEADVGSKTTVRMGYPESSSPTSDIYRHRFLYVVVLFKPHDADWLADVAAGKKVRSSLKFWKAVATALPVPAEDFRVFNPLILRETATLIGFDIGSGKMKKNVPTTGSLAISIATRLCDEVSVAGFGYQEDKPLHYYDTVKMSLVRHSWTHDIDKEKLWLQKLVVQGIIHDLTGGIVR